MKKIKYTKKELINKIKSKKELSGITNSVIEESLNPYIKNGLDKIRPSEIKVIIKMVRAEMRALSGQFQKTLKNKKKIFREEPIEFLLRTHSSTAERINDYPKLKKIIKSLNVRSILDLGCGLNPIALADKKMRYYAADIKEDELSLIKNFFTKNKIIGNAFVYDLRKIKNDLPVVDLCVIFKVLDVLASNKKSKYILTEKILKTVKCKFFLISFPTKKLSGKSMNFPERTWFEKILKKLELSFKKFSIDNEIFYLITT